MLLADNRLPTGAHTQSAGLEPAVRGGMPVREVPDYLAVRLATVTLVEAGAAVVARAVAGRGHRDIGDSAHDLDAVEQAWRARTVGPALRETAALLGRGYLRLAGRLWPSSTVVAALGRVQRPSRAVVLGGIAALVGLDDAALIRLIGYDEVQTVCAAALKVEPGDPVQATSWALASQPLIERMVAPLVGLQDPDEIPSGGAPLLEQWSQQHAAATHRLFRA
ncbi:urease accessory protein UreF [Nakamurella sp. YIM 132084]|uniref:Urease accessory protein UreF n=2 Tax=Nakamurella leprariae TaxID=2803911 RepID=A0A938YE39_9ACTN|nr:urease accessory protein UreF [Nakamurella leprariae]